MNATNPTAAAPPTPPRLSGWAASVSAGVAVLLVVAGITAATVAIVSAVDRDEMRSHVAKETEPTRERLERVEQQTAENHSLLVELKTKIDLLLGRYFERTQTSERTGGKNATN